MQFQVSLTAPGAFRTVTDALTAASPDRRHLMIEPGTYTCSSTLMIDDPVTIVAVGGPGTVILLSPGAPAVRASADALLEGVTLRSGNGYTLAVTGKATVEAIQCDFTAAGRYAITATGGSLILRRCWVRAGGLLLTSAHGFAEQTTFRGSPDTAIQIEGNSAATFRHCEIRDPAGGGIRVCQQSTPLIEDTHVAGARATAIQVSEGSRAELHRLRIEDAGGSGVQLDTQAQVLLNQSDILRAAGHGVDAGGSAAVTVLNSRVSGSGWSGIRAGAGSVCVADNVTLSAGHGPGLTAEPGASVTLRGGAITDNHGPAIAAAQASQPGSGIAVQNVTIQRNGDASLNPGGPGPGAAVPLPPPALAAPARQESLAPQSAPFMVPPTGNPGVDALVSELNQMIGLTEVKKEIATVIDQARLNQVRRQAGLPSAHVAHSLIFAGPPGTGKTTVARLYSRLLAALGMLRTGQVIEASRGDLVGALLGETTKKTTAVFRSAVGGVLFIDEAYALARRFGAGTDFGQEAIDTLVKLMGDYGDQVVLIAAGYTVEMRKFLDANPGLASRFEKTITFTNYTPGELVEITAREARRRGYALADGTAAALLRHCQQAAHGESFGNARDALKILDQLIAQQSERLAHQARVPSVPELCLLLPADLAGIPGDPLAVSFGLARDRGQVEAVLREFSQLTGLAQVKEQIRGLIDLISASRRRQAAGLAARPVNHHLIFAGPPGTGKTTVARMYGRLLAALGVARGGQLIEVTRTDLVSQRMGETAQKTTEVFGNALGGVLFIDEAYALARSPGDYGQEAIDTLVSLMEDHRDEVTVIVAGYADEMKRFLAANPGLASRFDTTITFAPYSAAELVQIFAQMAAAEDFTLGAGTEAALGTRIAAASAAFAQGNAREVRKLFESIVVSQSERLEQAAASGREPTRQQLQELTGEDVMSAQAGF